MNPLLRRMRWALPALLVAGTLVIEVNKGAVDATSLTVALLAAFSLGLMLAFLLQGFALLVGHESAAASSKRARERALQTDMQQLERSLAGFEFDAQLKRFAAEDVQRVQTPLKERIEELRGALEALEASGNDALEAEIDEEVQRRLRQRLRDAAVAEPAPEEPAAEQAPGGAA